MTPGADVSRSIVEAIERSYPGQVQVESDEEGRPRVVKLELYPRDGDIASALARIAAEPTDRAAAVDRCMAVVRDVVGTHARAEAEITKLRSAALVLGAKGSGVTQDLIRAARKRQDEAFARARAALEQLIDEAPL